MTKTEPFPVGTGLNVTNILNKYHISSIFILYLLIIYLAKTLADCRKSMEYTSKHSITFCLSYVKNTSKHNYMTKSCQK